MNHPGTAVRAVRYRVLPGTQSKAHRLNRIAGACRHVWNQMLADQDDLHRIARMNGARAPSVTFFTLGKAFAELRNSDGHEWLRELPFGVVRYTLKRQADAWRRFFDGQGGRPKFKGRGDNTAGFTIPERVRLTSDGITVPKAGRYRLRRRGGNPWPEGKPKQAVFTREGRKWYCTVFYEVAAPSRVDDGTAVGIDRNVGQCALSDGKIVRLPDTSRLEARRKRYQRRMVRQTKGKQAARTHEGQARRHVETTRQRQVELGAPGVAGNRGQLPHGRRRGSADEGHDGQRRRHGREPRDERPGEGGTQPGHPRERMGRVGTEPGLQGGARRAREPGAHVADLPPMRPCGRGQQAGRKRLSDVRPAATRRTPT